MDYEEKYKTALEKAKEIINYYKSRNRNEAAIEDLQEIFPELKESEDEKIRETLIKFHKSTIDIDGIKGYDILSWLEKQGNKPKQISIWKHWKDGIAGNGEGEPIYLVKNGNTYSLNSCLGCECDYIELSELDKLMLEKQGEQKPAWSVKDEAGLGDALWAIQQARTIAKDENDMGNLWYAEKWLNSLKKRLQKS